MKIVYVFDTFCGWCYGFDKVFAPFIANHPEVDLEIISGGLFSGHEGKDPSMIDHFKEANARITQYYGTPFGKAYNEKMAKGELKMNSAKPAIAFALVRNMLPKTQWAQFVYAIQQAFYMDGKDLTTPEVYVEVAKKHGVDAEAYAADLKKNWSNDGIAKSDFRKAQSMGVMSFPTLLIEVNGTYYNLLHGARTVEQLERNFQNYAGMSASADAPSCSIDGCGC